ncbi:MAG: hypothetical protein ACOC1F_00970, partial [Myxococcota bacterium]
MFEAEKTVAFIDRQYDGSGRFRFSPAGTVTNLYSTCFGVLARDLLSARRPIPADQRDALVATLRSYQSPETGLFVDGTLVPAPGSKHDREYVEHQQTDFALMALHALGATAFSDDGSPVWNGSLLREALRRTSAFGGMVVEHPELPSLTEGGSLDEGPAAEKLGVGGIPCQAETG